VCRELRRVRPSASINTEGKIQFKLVDTQDSDFAASPAPDGPQGGDVKVDLKMRRRPLCRTQPTNLDSSKVWYDLENCSLAHPNVGFGALKLAAPTKFLSHSETTRLAKAVL
jgi:hypothetical protein